MALKHSIGLTQIKGKTYYEVRQAYPLGEEIKQAGARFNHVRGSWLLPPINASIENLKRLYGVDKFTVTEQVATRLRYKWKFPPKQSIPELHLLKQSAIQGLSPYQYEAVQFLLNSPHPGSLLAFGPGVGKTPTSLAAASGYKRVLIVTPFTLMLNWEIECRKWLGFVPRRCYKQGPSQAGWVVSNYDTVMRRVDEYTRPWDLIISDESLLLKNRDASRTIALKEIRKNVPKVWLLSGSPISKYVDDLYSQLEIIYPSAFTSYWRFARTYCYVEETKWADKVTGNRQNIDLRNEFLDLVYIRDRREVLPALPEFTFEDIQLEMGMVQARIYDTMVEEFIVQLESGEEITAANKAVQLIRLQQVVSGPKNFGEEWPEDSIKTDALIDLIGGGSVTLPMIVWTHWSGNARELFKRLQKKFPDLRIGLTRSKDKQRGDVIQSFINGGLDIIIMSLGIGKYGHTMTNAQTVLYYDKTYDGDAYIQSLARVQRRGLEHSPHVITLKCPGTSDDLIAMNLENKSRSIHQLTNSDLVTLLRSLNNVRHRN